MAALKKTEKVELYNGNGPYCYTNSLSSMLGRNGPGAAVIEILTGSPFGFQLLAGRLPLFDPYGWNPDIGLDQAISLLGYTCKRRTFATADEAVTALSSALLDGPVMLGPLDMGLLHHQPDSDRASGADHFVVALGLQGRQIAFHDPQGYPWVSLPLDVFCAAWRGETIEYLEGAYAMRTGFERVRQVTILEALRASLPDAHSWMVGKDLPVPLGTLGGRAGLGQLAQMVEGGLQVSLRQFLIQFALRLAARRKADASMCLADLEEFETANLLREQARVLGSLQYAAVRSDGLALATGFRRLGELHDEVEANLLPYASI